AESGGGRSAGPHPRPRTPLGSTAFFAEALLRVDSNGATVLRAAATVPLCNQSLLHVANADNSWTPAVHTEVGPRLRLPAPASLLRWLADRLFAEVKNDRPWDPIAWGSS